MTDLAIVSSYSLRSWGSLYQRKLQIGLSVSPAMIPAQKWDVQAAAS
jgi:hypothetical protein